MNVLLSNERQKHGFEYENLIIKKYNMLKINKYTHKYDAYYKFKGRVIPVQIKCIKYGSSIELGDYRRNKHKKENFILFVGFWKENKDNIIKETILFIDRKKFISNLEFDHDNEIFSTLNLITNLICDDLKWKSFTEKYKNLWPKKNLISIRFKRDHKTQKRIQCAIPWKKFNTFCESFYIIS